MRFATRFGLVSAALLAIAFPTYGSARTISGSYPPLAAHAVAPEKFIPAGWHLWQVRKGDLNSDGISDAVLIMKRDDSGETYRVAVVFANPAGGFDLAADNTAILTGVPDHGFVPYPDSNGFRIRHGAFSIKMISEGPGGAAELTFTFRYQDGRFVLIGYDYLGDHRGWLKLSFNMLTGQVVETEGADYEGNERVVEKRSVGTFAPPKLVEMGNLGYGFDFNESFNPFKYAPIDPTR